MELSKTGRPVRLLESLRFLAKLPLHGGLQAQNFLQIALEVPEGVNHGLRLGVDRFAERNLENEAANSVEFLNSLPESIKYRSGKGNCSGASIPKA